MDPAPARELTEAAFEMLFREHQAEVCRWIARIVRDRAAAEDLTIETFWRVYRSRRRFDPSRPFLPWARRIATRAAIDHLRVSPRAGAADLERVAAPATSDPAVDRETRRRIERAFAGLPAPLRAAATLALIEELPYSEIAEALDISAGAVKMRVSRAVGLLRKRLEREGLRP
jgi:RNA polymerase sigma-70 factor (ECF subfamily)